MYKPFPSQQKRIDLITDFVNSKSNKKAVYVMPVAYGKSIVIANVAMNFPDKYFINIAPNKELVQQNYEKYTSYGFEASLCSASLNSNEVSKVTFATIGTLKKHVDFFKDKDVVLLQDECFPYDTYIDTEEGSIKLGKLCGLLKNKKNAPKVLSYNQEKEVYEYKKVTAYMEKGVKEVRKYTFLNGFSLKCTPNHKILTLDGWKKAEDLNKGDAVISSNDINVSYSYPLLNRDQLSIVIGSSLGDGCFDYRHNENSVARIRMIQGRKQKDYLYWKAFMLKKEDTVEKIENNGYSSTVAYRFNSKVFYFPEKLKNYKSQIDLLDSKSLAILWMDDGSLGTNKYNGRLYSLCSDKDLVEYLNKKINSLGIPNTIVVESKSSSTKRKYWYIRFRKNSLEVLFKKIAKYIHKDFYYKIWDIYNKDIGSYKWNNDFDKFVCVYKKSEEYKKTEVYDITVEDNHNFIVKSCTTKPSDKKGGVVVHNCHQASNRDGELDLFLKEIKKHKLIGVTATPMRLNNVSGGTRLSMMNRQRKCVYSSIQDVVQVSEVIKENRWSKLVYEVENVDETKLQLNTSGTDYTLKSLKAFSEANNIVEKCVESVLRLREEGRKSCIVYVPSIQEAEDVVSKLEGSAVLHSKLKKQERDRVINSFLSDDLETIVNVEILKQGFDYPLLSSIVIARPTNSYTLYYQILGRAVRVHKDKKNAKVVDLSGNYNKFGAIEDLEFVNEDYTEGWAAFSGDRLLTDYALGNSIVPTKQSLKEHFDLMTNPQYVPQDPKFPFGKHKNKRVSEVFRTDQGYLAWITNPETNFKFRGKEGAALKIGIYRKLKLPIKNNRDVFFDKKDKGMKNKFDRFLA